MSFRYRTEIRLLLTLALAVVASGATVAASSGTTTDPLRICAEPDNLPMSQKSSDSGFEIEVARLVAKDLGRPLEVVWVTQRDHSYFAQTIGVGHCDAIMNVPANFARLTTTQPWYRTGFVFVSRKDRIQPNNFDDPRLRSLSIAVPATGLGETTPEMALTKRSLAPQLRPYSVYDPSKMIADVAARKVDLAIVFGPFAGWFGRESKVPLSLKPTPDQDGPLPFAFDIAIGVRKGNEALKLQLEQALEHQRAAIAAVLVKWHVPLRKT